MATIYNKYVIMLKTEKKSLIMLNFVSYVESRAHK